MSNPRRQKKILRDIPDLTTARQEETLRQFRDTVLYHNQQMGKLGLCDGNNCKYHQVVPGSTRDMCRCKRVSASKTVQEKKYWERMHFENCSVGKSMEKNIGCRGFEMEGMPLYNEKIRGRKII